MITIIAGSRDVTDYQVLLDAVAESGFEITRWSQRMIIAFGSVQAAASRSRAP